MDVNVQFGFFLTHGCVYWNWVLPCSPFPWVLSAHRFSSGTHCLLLRQNQRWPEDPWLSLAEDPWIRLTLTFLYPGLWFRASKQHMQEKMPSRNARTGTLIKHMPMHSLLAEKAESVFSKISTLLLGLHSQLAGTWDHNTAIFCHFYCSIKDVFFVNFKIPIFLSLSSPLTASSFSVCLC